MFGSREDFGSTVNLIEVISNELPRKDVRERDLPSLNSCHGLTIDVMHLPPTSLDRDQLVTFFDLSRSLKGNTTPNGGSMTVLNVDRGRVRLRVVSSTEGSRAGVRGRVRSRLSRVGRVESEAE